MLDIARTLSASTSVHALTGSSRPGAVPPLVPLGAAMAGQPACGHDGVATSGHVDPEVIDLAGRVKRLAPRESRVSASLFRREDAVSTNLPTLSPHPQPKNRTEMTAVEAGGRYTATFSYPTTPDEDHLTAMEAWNAEVAEKARIEAALNARLCIPRWRALSARTYRRLIRWSWRLTYMQPLTQAGLKAKADAAVAIMQTGASDTWAAELHASVSRDALRIICAEADARAREDQARDGELLALGRLWEKSCERDDQAHRRLVEAEERYDAPPQPEALFFDPERDPPVLSAHSSDHVPSGLRWYGRSSVIHTLRRPWHYAFCLARRNEILAAYDGWMAADAAERERAGIPEAQAEVDASVSENAALRAAICRLPAHTPTGVNLKVRVIVWLHDDIETLAREMRAEDLEDPEFASSLAMSLALDLARGGVGLATSVVPAADLASAARRRPTMSPAPSAAWAGRKCPASSWPRMDPRSARPASCAACTCWSPATTSRRRRSRASP